MKRLLDFFKKIKLPSLAWLSRLRLPTGRGAPPAPNDVVGSRDHHLDGCHCRGHRVVRRGSSPDGVLED